MQQLKSGRRNYVQEVERSLVLKLGVQESQSQSKSQAVLVSL